MKKQIDDLGRIVIPKEMRRELKLDNGSTVNVELVEGSIVLTNPRKIDYKAALDKIEDYIVLTIKECEKHDVIPAIYNLNYLLEIINKTKGE